MLEARSIFVFFWNRSLVILFSISGVGYNRSFVMLEERSISIIKRSYIHSKDIAHKTKSLSC